MVQQAIAIRFDMHRVVVGTQPDIRPVMAECHFTVAGEYPHRAPILATQYGSDHDVAPCQREANARVYLPAATPESAQRL